MKMLIQTAWKGTLLAATCMLSWSATMVDAATISLIPNADARLANDSNRGPTSNTGSEAQWEVRWHSAPRVRIGYVRYDITGINPALYSSATLSGTFTASGFNGPAAGTGKWNVYGLNDDVVASGGILGNDWGETAINYSNAAGVDNLAALGTFAFTSDVTLLGTLSLDGVDVQPLPFASNTTDLDLTAFLNADTDGLVTFLFMDVAQNGDEYRIDSKEGNMLSGHHPTTLNFVPEPTTLGLVWLGAAGLWTRRRGR